jgi:F-type H+-transporting ATPase subunit a
MTIYVLSQVINRNWIVSTRWSIMHEVINDTILSIMRGQITSRDRWGYYYPMIYIIFVLIITSNILSIIPYSLGLITQVVLVISISVIIWLGLTIIGFHIYGIFYIGLLVPIGTPIILVPILVIIELLSYVSRAFSLGLRLVANMISGHLLILIISGLLISMNILLMILPILGILAIISLELVIGIIQAYVWCILTSSYLKDALYIH